MNDDTVYCDILPAPITREFNLGIHFFLFCLFNVLIVLTNLIHIEFCIVCEATSPLFMGHLTTIQSHQGRNVYNARPPGCSDS